MTMCIIFTDGSSTVYKNKNGLKFGGIGVYIKDHPEYNISRPLIGKEVTNQKAELIACIEAINLCKKIGKTKIILYSDSMYTINCATKWAKTWESNGWKRQVGKQLKEVLNLEYVKELYELIKGLDIKFIHVRSHQKEPIKDDMYFIWEGNNIVDKLASDAMNKIIKNVNIIDLSNDTIIIN
jgi:ribonuclease HI